jgi:hypothetical protein
MIITDVKAGTTHLSIVEWTDSIGRPLSVSNVEATLYFYEDGIYTVIEANLVPEQQPENTFRYTQNVSIPADTEGQNLYLDYSATYDDDQTTLRQTQKLQVGSLAQPSLRASFT